MSDSSCTENGGLVTYDLKVGGNTLPDTVIVKSILVEKKLNKVATATFIIIDGDASNGKFPASSSDNFVPGTKVSVETGYNSVNYPVFKGIVTKQSIRIDEEKGPVLEVECRDEAIKMIVGRKSVAYIKKKDSDIISTIVKEYSGLSSKVTATPTVWPEQIQYYATDWDFILARAEANGMVVTTLNGEVAVFSPSANTKSVLEVTYGENLMEFNAELNSITQLNNVTASSWNYETQKVNTGQTSNSYKGPGNLSSKKLSEVVGLSKYDLQSTAPLTSTELTDWSKAQLVKSNYSKIQGEMKLQGTEVIEPGTYITLDGLGERFNGDHLVSGVHHEISDGNWITEVSVGFSNIWFTEEPDVMAPPASGLLPGVQGLFNGVVKKIDDDPDKQYRILIDIPLFDKKREGIWARLTNFYSTNGAGVFFLPEIGDEVIVGFLNEDPRFPVILGSVYSGATHKPFTGLTPNNKNSKKAIVSNSKIFIEFDDENKVFTIETPKKNTFILSDKDKKITIKDQNNNSIIMSSSGIDIKSPKNINIEANQKVTIKGKQGVNIESSPGDVDIKGTNIKLTAKAQLAAKASASAQINGGLNTTIKGAMVMIN
ncbi:type VI secretion system tip protein VgrG [Dokdonia sp.]|uniref:type VI secretion system tip protein VgrG n=1 Tax=Dokdonia sp. TaxID=2024995 RepID=UPI003267F3E3